MSWCCCLNVFLLFCFLFFLITKSLFAYVVQLLNRIFFHLVVYKKRKKNRFKNCMFKLFHSIDWYLNLCQLIIILLRQDFTCQSFHILDFQNPLSYSISDAKGYFNFVWFLSEMWLTQHYLSTVDPWLMKLLRRLHLPLMKKMRY